MSYNKSFPDCGEENFNSLFYQVGTIKEEWDRRKELEEERVRLLEKQIKKCNALLYDIGFNADQLEKYWSIEPKDNLFVSRFLYLTYIDILLYRERKYLSKYQLEEARKIIQGYARIRSQLTKESLKNIILKAKGEPLDWKFEHLLQSLLASYDYFLKWIPNKDLADKIFLILNYNSITWKEDFELLLK